MGAAEFDHQMALAAHRSLIDSAPSSQRTFYCAPRELSLQKSTMLAGGLVDNTILDQVGECTDPDIVSLDEAQPYTPPLHMQQTVWPDDRGPMSLDGGSEGTAHLNQGRGAVALAMRPAKTLVPNNTGHPRSNARYAKILPHPAVGSGLSKALSTECIMSSPKKMSACKGKRKCDVLEHADEKPLVRSQKSHTKTPGTDCFSLSGTPATAASKKPRRSRNSCLRCRMQKLKV